MGSPEAFLARWKAQLEQGAQVKFAAADRDGPDGNYCAVANAFVETQGLQPIGFNWELLDAEAGPGEPRSALGTLAGALSHDMERPQSEWLGPAAARDCASDFIALFEAGSRTLVSNRLKNLWNPISPTRIEWAFLGNDARRIALLLIART